jgi:hypothetical protein
MSSEFIAVECDDGKGFFFLGSLVEFLQKRTGGGFLVQACGGTPEPWFCRLEGTTMGPFDGSGTLCFLRFVISWTDQILASQLADSSAWRAKDYPASAMVNGFP